MNAYTRPTPARSGTDWWPTPPCLIASLVHVLADDPQAANYAALDLYEPAAGDGRIATALRAEGHHVLADDIEPRSPGIVARDFLADPLPAAARHRLLVCNPPYSILDPWIARCHSMLDSGEIVGAALLLRVSHLTAAGRAPALARAASIHVTTWRPRWVKDSTGRPVHDFAWVIWL